MPCYKSAHFWKFIYYLFSWFKITTLSIAESIFPCFFVQNLKYVRSQSRYLHLSGKHEADPPHFWQPDSLTKLLHSLGTWWLAPAAQKLRPCISQLAAAERKAENQQICFNQAFGQISQNSVRGENKGHGREWFWFLTLFGIFILVPLFFYYYDPDIIGLALINIMSVQSVWKPVWCVMASRIWTLLFAESTEWLKVFGASDPERSLWPLVWEGSSSSSLAVLSPPFMVIWIDIQGQDGTGDGWCFQEGCCLLMVHLHHTGQGHLFLRNLAPFNT